MTDMTFSEQQNLNFALMRPKCTPENFSGRKSYETKNWVIENDVFDRKANAWNLKILETVPILVKMVHFDRSPL